MAFSIATINCYGLRDSHKRGIIFDYLRNSSFDIFFLQECYCVSESETKLWTEEFGGTGFWSYGDFRSRGVGILFKPGVNFKITDIFRDTDGRLLRLDCVQNSQNLRLVNVYMPNDPHARKEFIKALDSHLTGSMVKILGGDFNFVESSSLDKQGGNIDKGTEGVDEIRSIKHDFQLLDIYRYLHPHTRSFTWSGGNTACRLDRFYISVISAPSCLRCDVIPVSFSDHCAVTLQIKLPDAPHIGPGYWKCNVSVLDDVDFKNDFESHWGYWADVPLYDSTWWDQVKIRIKDLIISHSKRLARRRRNDIKIL